MTPSPTGPNVSPLHHVEQHTCDKKADKSGGSSSAFTAGLYSLLSKTPLF